MQQDVVFQGIAAPLRLTGAEAILPVLQDRGAGWPARPMRPIRRPARSSRFRPSAGSDFSPAKAISRAPRRATMRSMRSAMRWWGWRWPARRASRPDLPACRRRCHRRAAGGVSQRPARGEKHAVGGPGARWSCAFQRRCGAAVLYPRRSRARTCDGDRTPLAAALARGAGAEFRNWAETVGGPRNRQYLYLSLPAQPPRGAVLPLGAFVILDRQDTAGTRPGWSRWGPRSRWMRSCSRTSPGTGIPATSCRSWRRCCRTARCSGCATMICRGAVACLERRIRAGPTPCPSETDAPAQRFRLADLDAAIPETGRARARWCSGPARPKSGWGQACIWPMPQAGPFTGSTRRCGDLAGAGRADSPGRDCGPSGRGFPRRRARPDRGRSCPPSDPDGRRPV